MAVKTWALTTPADDALKNSIPGLMRDTKEHAFTASGFYAEQQSTPDQTIAIYAGIVYFGATKVEYPGLAVVDLGTGGAFEASALTADYYNKILFTINSAGTLEATEGTEGTSAGAVTDPVIPIGKYPICMVTVQDDGTGTAGTILTIEQSEIQQTQGVGYVFNGTLELSTKTVNYSVLVTDANKQIILSNSAITNRAFTLPSVGADENGLVINFYNDSNYNLIISPSDDDAVWVSGAGYGIQTDSRGAYCSLAYNHASTTWIPLQIGGGIWMVEDLHLHAPLRVVTIYDIDGISSLNMTPDISRQHYVNAYNGVRIAGEAYNDTSILFGGTDEYLSSPDGADWNIFTDDTEDVTIFCRVRFDAAASAVEGLISQRESATDEWYLSRDATGEISFDYQTTEGASEIHMTSTGVLAGSTYYNICFARKGTSCGLYFGELGSVLDQVAFDNVWTVDPAGFAAALEIGRWSTNYFVGRMSDVVIARQNLFNAAPVSGLTDTISVPANPINLTIGG